MRQESIQALESVSDYLGRMKLIIPDIIKAYRRGDSSTASSDMILLSEGLQWINEVLHLTANFHKVNNLEVKEIYFEFIEAFENQDSVLLADLLEYELIPKLEEWKVSLDESIASYAN